MMNTYKARSLMMTKMQNYIPLSMLVVGVFATQTGCVDAGETLRILRNQAPSEGCVIPTGESDQFLSSGIIDTDANGGYLFTPLIESRAVGNNETDRRIFLKSAVVRLRFEDDFFDDATLNRLEDEGLTRFSQPVSGSIPANGSSTLAFELISKQLLVEMAAAVGDGVTRVTADVEIRGTVDGGDVASPTFSYPVEVCTGCLTRNLGACTDVDDSSVQTGGVCQPLQDGFVDCCTAADDSLVCPAVASSAEPE